MSHDAKRLMSIGETTKALNVTRRIILNYEDKGLVLPTVKEGKTGNRYYDIDTVSRIRTIRLLQNFGLSLDEIYAYYNDVTTLEPLIHRLETLRDELNFNIEKLKERVKTGNDFKIQTITIPAQTVYCQALHAVTVQEKKEHLREIVITAIKMYGSDTSKRMFFNQTSLDNPDYISYCVAVPPESEGEHIVHLPEEKALCITYHGSYESLPSVRDKILAYAKENQISLKRISRNIFLEGPPQHKNPEHFITQVALLIQAE